MMQGAIYMETPCKHRYHERCLREWMVIKEECPKCRSILPKIDPEPSDAAESDEDY
jgi:Ring finger domain